MLAAMPFYRLKLSVTLFLLAAIGGCARLLPTPTPMRAVDYAAARQPAKCLFVLLPGMGDHAETFERRGFVKALRKSGLSIDIRAADATIGYYMKGTMLERFSTDVMAPAKARGYREIWLLGPSMGGFGSLFYARAHTDDITGVLAIAPYLGDRTLIEEITLAGGLKNWRAPERIDEMNEKNFQREMWRWLQAVTQGKEAAPLIFAGYGSSDKLRAADSLLTAELPPSRVFLTYGKHEWPAWQRVLQGFLASPDFSSHCR
jgi:pimeloyl-ACP methyl ester carboxylesterase